MISKRESRKPHIDSHVRLNEDAIYPQVLSSAELNGQLHLFARGDDSKLWYTTREGGVWNLTWDTIDQRLQSQPSSIVWGMPKRLSLFFIRDDNMVMTSAKQYGNWGDFQELGAQASSPAVTCLEEQGDLIHVWARENSEAGRIIHNYWDAKSDAWHTQSPDWETGISTGVAKGSRSTPAVVCRNSTTTNDVILYDKDFGSALHRQWNNSRNSWGPWHDLVGPCAGDPVAVALSADSVSFFGISRSNKTLSYISWTDGLDYTTPYSLGGAWSSVPSVVVAANNSVHVFARNAMGMIEHRAMLNSTWNASWTNLGIAAASAPLATVLDTQPIQIVLNVLGSGGDMLSSDWEVTDDGTLEVVAPVTSIGGNLSHSWMVTD